jgi:DNA-binding transcriptional LysR family regulator
MDLRHLRYFVAVAEEGHVTRAAERLGIQQPPLSQQIKALETELEVQLFRRKPRGVELTEAGESLLVDARRILDQVAAALARAQRTARGEQGRLAVGFTASAPFHPFVTRIIRDFRTAHPLVSMTLQESGTAELVEDLLSERLDVAFVRSAVSKAEGLAVYNLFEEPMVAALPARHPLARRRGGPLALAELSGEPFVLYRRAAAPGLHDAIVGACQAAGFTLLVPSVADAPRAIREGRVNTIPGTTENAISEEHADLVSRATRYAGAYNALLLRRGVE